ncbi:MAG: hypothetical protein R3A13_10405 [Bdellovibrionota bacterium]
MTDKNLVDKSEYQFLVEESNNQLDSKADQRLSRSQKASIFGSKLVPVLILLLIANLIIYFVYSTSGSSFQSPELANSILVNQYPAEASELLAIDNFFSADWEFRSYEDDKFKNSIAELNKSMAELGQAPYPIEEFKYDGKGLYYVSKE